MARLLAVTVASILLSYTADGRYIAYPMRLFTTLIHEGGHVVATIISGGSVQKLDVFQNGSGVTISSGGIPLLIYPAGYIGSALFGAGILLITRRMNGKKLLLILATLLFCETAFFIRPINGDITGLLAGSALAFFIGGAGLILPEGMANWIAVFLGVQCCLNTVYDLRVLLQTSNGYQVQNDAVLLAHYIPLPPIVFAITWAIVGIGGLIIALKFYLSEQ